MNPEDSMEVLETLLAEVRRLQDEGRLPKKLTQEQVADWAYGNAKLENEDVTREMAERAAARISNGPKPSEPRERAGYDRDEAMGAIFDRYDESFRKRAE